MITLCSCIENLGCGPIRSHWRCSENRWKAGIGLDPQVSKWPWVMGVADYTCSWLITVITLHRPCTLIHLSTVITGDGNHQGATPNLCPPAVKDYFITACIWWPKTTNNLKLFTNLYVMVQGILCHCGGRFRSCKWICWKKSSVSGPFGAKATFSGPLLPFESIAMCPIS